MWLTVDSLDVLQSLHISEQRVVSDAEVSDGGAVVGRETGPQSGQRYQEGVVDDRELVAKGRQLPQSCQVCDAQPTNDQVTNRLGRERGEGGEGRRELGHLDCMTSRGAEWCKFQLHSTFQ